MDSFYEYCKTHASSIEEIQIYYKKHKQHINKNIAFRWSCKHGYLNIAKWLYSLGGVDLHADDDHVFKCCSRVQWLYSLEKNIQAQNGKIIFQISCENGHLNVAQWLHSLGNINHKEIDKYIFRKSCINGHLDVAKWINSLGYVNIHTSHEYAFRKTCDNGYLNVVQWLYSLGGVDIHEDNEYAFRSSCIYGYLDVAKWLYSLTYIDIRANNDEAFRFSCENGHLDVVQWLSTICSDYEIINISPQITFKINKNSWFKNTNIVSFLFIF